MCNLTQTSFVRYIISGCFNTGLSFAVYSTGILLGLEYKIANLIAWSLSVVVAFPLASRYVFQKQSVYKRFPIFVLSNIFSLVVTMIMLSVFINGFSMNPIVASIITIPIMMVMNFIAMRLIVFR